MSESVAIVVNDHVPCHCCPSFSALEVPESSIDQYLSCGLLQIDIQTKKKPLNNTGVKYRVRETSKDTFYVTYVLVVFSGNKAALICVTLPPFKQLFSEQLASAPDFFFPLPGATKSDESQSVKAASSVGL